MSKISVLIPHHRNPKLLQPLFRSLLDMDMDSSHVEYILVDNASKDGSAEFVRRAFPTVRIISFSQNEGFAPALNQASRMTDSEWLCFLNNDVRVDRDWLSNLLYAANQTDASCVSSHILDWKGKRTQFAGGWINLFGKGFESRTIQQESPYEIFFPCGCGMMIRRDLFFTAGGFDDEYFMLYEDIDLGWRLRLYGHPVYLVPNARIRHRGHASLNQIPYTEKALYYERNSLATLYKNLSETALAVILPLALREAIVRTRTIGGIGVPFHYNPEGMAILDAVNQFYRQLPHWKEKRKVIQQKRIVEDGELFSRFFPHPAQVWAFKADHYKRIHYPAAWEVIQESLQSAAEVLDITPAD